MEEPRKVLKKKEDNPLIAINREKDRKPVRGKFIFHEVPGGTVKFPYRKWKGDDVQMFELTDGHVYTIPLGVAKHLNKNCAYPVHAFQVDDNGKPVARIGEMKRRMSFQSLEFMDLDDVGPETKIIQATSDLFPTQL